MVGSFCAQMVFTAMLCNPLVPPTARTVSFDTVSPPPLEKQCSIPRRYYTRGRHGKKIALTFDDGPSVYTRPIARILKAHHADATFFEIGSQIRGQGNTLRLLHRQGFLLGDHSWFHEELPSTSSLRKTRDVIKESTGFKTCVFRAPYGLVNRSLVERARSLGLATIGWSVDTRDWSLPGTQNIIHTAIRAHGGDIVLFHDGGGPRDETIAALPSIISNLQHRGYKLVNITELIN